MEQPLLTIDIGMLSWSDGIEALEESGMPLPKGNQIRFKVRGNPTTGYEWVVNEAAANGLFTVERKYVRDEAPERYVGVGGTYYFTLTAGD